MPVFQYTAVDRQGKQVKGETAADSMQNALTAIKRHGLFPVKVAEKKDVAANKMSESSFFKQKIKKKHIAIFARQFASMLQAGVPLPILLDVLRQQEKNAEFKKILESINADIMRGNTLSGAMSRFSEFPPLMISMVEVGEANGRLEASFDRIAINMEKELKLSAKIKGAMIYPVVLLCVTVLAGLMLSIFVLPKFADMFSEAGAELPIITQFLLGASTFLTTRWYILLGITAAVAIALFVALKQLPVKRKLHQAILQLPVIGQVQNAILMARFCRSFSSLIEGGVDVVLSLDRVKHVISNLHARSSFEEIIADVQAGATISQAIAKKKIFTPLVISMTRIGEESGRLGEVLQKTAELYEEESETRLQRMTAMAEPMVTVLMALGIGILVIGIVLPMFQMYRNVAG